MKRNFLISLAIHTIGLMLSAQDSTEIVILSPKVGDVINVSERDYYGLFQKIENFSSAMIVRRLDSTYEAQIWTVTSSGKEMKHINIPEAFIYQYAEKIEHFDELKAGTYIIGTQRPSIVVNGKKMERRLSVKAAQLQYGRHNNLNISDFISQDTAAVKLVKLNTTDGSEFIGVILSEDLSTISFKTISNISMVVEKNQIKDIRELSGKIVAGEYITADPNRTRLFFSPTARPLNSGEGYFSTYEIFFPFLAVGVTDYITLAGGISLIPGLENQIYYFAPKVTPINMDNFSVSGGVLYINSTAEGSAKTGIIYGVTSYGNPDASFTAGLGWGFFGDETADKPIVMIGGEVRLSNSIKFISENWFPPNTDDALVSFGFRFFGENLAADLGFIRPTNAEGDGFPFIPWVGFAYNFGNGK